MRRMWMPVVLAAVLCWSLNARAQSPAPAAAAPGADRTALSAAVERWAQAVGDYHVITVSGVRKGSPAEVAGLLKGDVIEALDGKPATDARVADLRQALLDEGSQHVIEIHRGTSGRLSLSLKVAVLSLEDN